MNIAALIIGIDGWEQYTLPLVQSIQTHEPDCRIVVIDNASAEPYPTLPYVHRTERLCYAKAINTAAELARNPEWYKPFFPDWYIVLSNDVLCTGSFGKKLETVHQNVVLGPCLKRNEAATYLEGWCVAASRMVWDRLGGWDENFQVSSWEDVDFSTSAIKAGFMLAHDPTFPFVHLDQKQRFGLIPNYWQSEVHNVGYFARKHGLSPV